MLSIASVEYGSEEMIITIYPETTKRGKPERFKPKTPMCPCSLTTKSS